MAIKITDDCINCGQCITECPNTAIYDEGTLWTMAEGTNLSGPVKTINGIIDAEEEQEPIGIGEDYFYIAPDKCTECIGFNPEPACAAVCPIDCCVEDEDHVESESELLAKKAKLHD
jgi:ferredoxin